MDKKDYLNAAFIAAKNCGRVHSVTEFAELLGFSRANVSAALNGNERYLSDKFIQKVEKALAYNGIVVGTTSVVAQTTTPQSPSFDTEEFEYLQRRVAELEMMVATMQKLIKKYEDEIDALKGGNVHARAKNA